MSRRVRKVLGVSNDSRTVGADRERRVAARKKQKKKVQYVCETVGSELGVSGPNGGQTARPPCLS